jgi:CRP/FNR family cyclic AMP-dependent transcriptional regulator
VSTFMNKFRKLGFIEYNGELKVHNSLLNVVLHDNPRLRSEEDWICDVFRIEQPRSPDVS